MVSENYLAVKDNLDMAKPQDFWFRRHYTILLNLLALGIGTLSNLMFNVMMRSCFPHLRSSNNTFRQARHGDTLFLLGFF